MENLERRKAQRNPRTQNTHPLAGGKSFDDIAPCMTQLITLSWPGHVIYLFVARLSGPIRSRL